jgi:hypothetical protein
MKSSPPCSSASLAAGVESPLSFKRILVVVFLVSLSMVNPIVHGDGVGYYAYARAPLIQHNLHFDDDWRRANLYFSQSRTLANGQLRPDEYTETGYVSNLFSIGPALLWTPFLLVAHAAVLLADALGAHIPADGFSPPYLVAMALGTAFYGFLGLWLSYSLATKYVEERWAFLATLGVWGASSLPVYMYFNPAWSHAHSVFAVALFAWYWERTRGGRNLFQWILLGLSAGLMVDVYFMNGVFLLLPLVESLLAYWKFLKARDYLASVRLLAENSCFLIAIAVAFLPTLITRYIIFGGFFRFGSYTILPWNWAAPNWCSVLFSSEHGLFSWTPILALAFVGLFLAPCAARSLALSLALTALGFYYVISSYPYWHGMASFGNRFFISLTPVFLFGLALLLVRFGALFQSQTRAFAAASVILLLFILWNLGFIFQWGAHLISPRGPVSFSQVAYNQVFVVPRQISSDLRRYLFKRKALMQQIEQKDVEQLNKDAESKPHEQDEKKTE